jgi:hypothetical protein
MRKTRTKEKDETGDDKRATNATTNDSQNKGPWVSPEIVECIEKLNYTVTPLDVSLQTGLPLREVQQQLNAAAILSGGRIEPRFPSSPTNPTHVLSIIQNGKEEAAEEIEGKRATSLISPILVYVFDPNLQSKLQKAGWRQMLSLFLKKSRKALFFGLRLSFGIALIASIVIAAIFAILIWIYLQNLNRGGDGGGGRERGRGGGGGGFSPFPPGGPGGGPLMGGPRFDFGDLWLFLMWQSHMDRVDRRTRYYYQQPQAYLPYPQQQGFRGGGAGGAGGYYPQHPLPIGAPSLPFPVSSPPPPPPPPGDEETGTGRRTAGRGREEMGFLEVVFSFLFGEKNTNRSKKKAFRVLASLINSNGGWLIAEQAVPYLDDVLLLPGAEEGIEQEGRRRTTPSSQHEGYILPIVHHFSGSVASTDDGQLVYLFPLQQLSTSSPVSSGIEESGTPSQLLSQLPPSPPLLEEPLIFSRATGQQLMWAFGLGLVNLLEVLGLGLLLFAGDGSLFRVLLEGGQRGGRGVPRGGREVEEGQLSVEAIVEFVEPILRPLWWGLLIYAIFFMAVPLFRWLWIKFLENKRILRRNERRMEKCEVAVSKLQSEEVQRKLQLARRVARSHFAAASSSSSSSSSVVPSALLPSGLTIQ